MLFVLYFFFLFGFGIVFVFNVFHTFFELRYAFAEAAHEFWDFLASEKEQDDEGNDDDFLTAQAAEE